MKILFIGGTGNISSAVSKLLVENGQELFMLNRGKRENPISGAKTIIGDINNESKVRDLLKNHVWDVVVNWIAFVPREIERDLRLFENKTKQYVFISSASAYQKPPSSPFITESTPLENPFWQYSRDKIECEEVLMNAFRKKGYPVTIVRPSHTYNHVLPVAFGGWTEYAFVERVKRGEKIIVPGDGTSLWVLTHALDFAKGFIGLLGLEQAIGHAFHITSDEVLSWNQIYEAVANALNCNINIEHIPSDFIVKKRPELKGDLLGDKSNSVIFDNSKIKQFVPSFKATIPFCQGIKDTLQWFQERPERMKINPEIDKMFDDLLKGYGAI